MKLVTLTANNPGVYTGRTGNNTYLLLGAEPTLIDSGVGDPAHIEAIAAALAAGGGGTLFRVIVTHVHPDHASGAPAIAARWPAARFFKFPLPQQDCRYPVDWQPIGDNDRVLAGEEPLVVIHTPGHALDHVALWHERTRTLFSGDLAVRGTTVVIPGGKGGSVRSYLQSLNRVLALNPSVLLPAHGPAIHDVHRVLEQYVAHRHERERQIVEALGRGPRTPDDLLRELYPAIHPRLSASARASVVAHLDKLQEERRAHAGPEGKWSLLSSSGESR
jgi:glyoxylase-like metal-dependent hydrolase (beta-lactamase superfamily II)